MGILLAETADPTAVAADPTAAAGSVSLVFTFVVYGLFIFAMWFFLFRPQSKEKKRVNAMLSALTIGDCVMTTSGFYGIVIDITDDTVIVEFGNNKNCRIPMDKSAISRVEKAEE